jgi:hypothetical protein
VRVRLVLIHVTPCTLCAQGVDVDRRMLDFLVGLDTEFSDLVDGTHFLTMWMAHIF